MSGVNTKRKLKRLQNQSVTQQQAMDQMFNQLRAVGCNATQPGQLPVILAELLEERRTMLAQAEERIALPPIDEEDDLGLAPEDEEEDEVLCLPDFRAAAPLPMPTSSEKTPEKVTEKTPALDAENINAHFAARVARAEKDGVSYSLNGGKKLGESVTGPAKIPLDVQRSILERITGRPQQMSPPNPTPKPR